MAVLKPLAKGNYYVWKYVPSLPASVIFTILWATITILLLWRMIKTRTWFCTSFVIGCLLQTIGYIARAAAEQNTDKLVLYAIQGSYILLPPAFYAATIYMCLGRIIRLVQGDHLSLVRPRRLTRIFVAGDVLSFICQGAGSSLQAIASTNPSMSKVSQAVVLLGLGIQIIFFAVFALTALLFHIRIRKMPTPRSYEVDPSWVRGLYMLYAVSVLIMVRSIFRLAEYAMGFEGYLLATEWPLYVFDTVPMFICSVIFFVVYPSKVTTSKSEEGIPMN